MRVTISTKFNAAEFPRKFRAAAVANLRKQVTERVRSAHCPVHGYGATTVTFGAGSDDLGIKLRGCCKQGLKAAQARLPLRRA